MNKLNIQDLSKLRITTVKPWCVNFIYDGEQYFLHDSSDEDRGLTLYHKVRNGKNEALIGKITLSTPLSFIRTKANIKFNWQKDCSKANIVYSQIDKNYFVKKLTYEEFIDSYYTVDCNRVKGMIAINNRRIADLKAQIAKLEKLNRELRG